VHLDLADFEELERAPASSTDIEKAHNEQKQGDFMWKKTLLLVGLVMLTVAPAHAQSIGFGPQLGYYRAKDADQGNFMGGLALRLKMLPLIGVEASINYRQERYANDAVTVRSWPLMVTGLVYPLPFLYWAMGVGWYNTTFDFDQDKFPLQNLADETKQEFGWHFGAGTELPVSPNFKLTGDLRYVFLNYDFDQVPGLGNLDSNFYVVTVGLIFGI
jgi:opacity protein-like surface antigen